MEIVSVLERWEPIGRCVLPDGTRLIGHVPHVAPEAYLHAIYGSLQPGEIDELERQLGRDLPDGLRRLFLMANGLFLFSRTLTLSGLRRRNSREMKDAWQPTSIMTPNIDERPRLSPADRVYFGFYSADGSRLALDSESNRVVRCSAGDGEVVYEWESLDSCLVQEVHRISAKFDSRGRLIGAKS